MGLFGSIGKIIGGVAKTAVGFATGGPLGAARAAVGAVAAATRGGSAPVPLPAPVLQLAGGGGIPRLGAGPGTQVARQGAVSPLGTVGLCGVGMRMKKDGGCTDRARPRMNVMNPRAANRAIKRIKGGMDLLKRIERQLPRRAAKASGSRKRGCGCK